MLVAECPEQVEPTRKESGDACGAAEHGPKCEIPQRRPENIQCDRRIGGSPEKNARIAVAAAPLSKIALLIDDCENSIAALKLLLTLSLLFGLPPTIALPLDCLRFRGGRSTWLNRRISDEGRL